MDVAAALLHPDPSCFDRRRFDAADYLEQLEEAVALQAIYADDFRVVRSFFSLAESGEV